MRDEVVHDHVGLAEDLRGERALRRVTEGARDRVLREGPAARAVHDLEADALEALEHARLVLGLAVLRLDLEGLWAHRRCSDHGGRLRRRGLDIAADPDRVLAVEDALRGHCAEAPCLSRVNISVWNRPNRSSFSSAWWCPSEPPRILIERRVDSVPSM